MTGWGGTGADFDPTPIGSLPPKLAGAPETCPTDAVALPAGDRSTTAGPVAAEEDPLLRNG